jgi:hypothetical protein
MAGVCDTRKRSYPTSSSSHSLGETNKTCVLTRAAMIRTLCLFANPRLRYVWYARAYRYPSISINRALVTPHRTVDGNRGIDDHHLTRLPRGNQLRPVASSLVEDLLEIHRASPSPLPEAVVHTYLMPGRPDEVAGAFNDFSFRTTVRGSVRPHVSLSTASRSPGSTFVPD